MANIFTYNHLLIAELVVLAVALVLFRKKFLLTDEKAAQISQELKERAHG